MNYNTKFQLTIFIVIVCGVFGFFYIGCGTDTLEILFETEKFKFFEMFGLTFLLIFIVFGIIPNKGEKGIPITSIGSFFKLREPRKEINRVLLKLINERKLNDSIKLELKTIIDNYNIKKDYLKKLQRKAFQKIYNGMVEDRKITESEKKDLEEIANYFEMSLEELCFDQVSFNKYYTLGKLEEGIIPVIEKHDVNIIFKKNELLHWAERAEILRTKKITERVSFSGPRGSIRIMKGLSYRYGSYNVKTYQREVTEIIDVGIFWITNLRVGYIGRNKNFTCNINQIHSLTVDDGLKIFKEGNQNPYHAWLNDYEVSLRMLSKLLNKEEK